MGEIKEMQAPAKERRLLILGAGGFGRVVYELAEELGVTDAPELRYLFDSKIRNACESEDVRVFGLVSAGPFRFQRSEIDEVRFWSWEEAADERNHRLFTPNLVAEIRRLLDSGVRR